MAWISFLTEFHEAESIGNTLVLFSDGTTGLRIHLPGGCFRNRAGISFLIYTFEEIKMHQKSK
jgi:hypothetical protein